MKDKILSLLSSALESVNESSETPLAMPANVQVTRPKDSRHGDFACNLALVLAKPAKRNPRELAQQLVDALPADAAIEKVELAGPGFINFFQSNDQQTDIVAQVLAAGDEFGTTQAGAGQKVLLEYVSANPTGPLHVGHGRGAAYGATLANILQATGHKVEREYYVNDAGRQMDILATSVWLRYLADCGETFAFPSNGYKGDYIIDIAQQLRAEDAEQHRHSAEAVFADVPADAPEGGDKEQHIDALIVKAKTLLGDANYERVFQLALGSILDDIRQDLGEFGVHYDTWFSERSLVTSGDVAQSLKDLEDKGLIYEQDGAKVFKSSDFGDEKDRVVVRANGLTTYFASDIAYMHNKFKRGFEHLVYIFGADHHGYLPRMKSIAQAFGYDTSRLEFPLIQFAVLYRNGEQVQMSTRSGEFVTLRQLRDDVSSDAARYFYVMRRAEQHLDFDLDLAKSQSNENPMFYVQYAHARVCSVFRQLAEKGLEHDVAMGNAQLSLLTESHESELLNELSRYTEVLESAARNREPHLVTNYLRQLANAFHSYYNSHQFIVDDENLRNARLNLISATRRTLASGLSLLDVSAPQAM